ncbi:MAG TPA: trypsin-like peptidase domain-containing protein [Candidatus Polarisedimenticolia bacterium]|jgi:serine protease Do
MRRPWAGAAAGAAMLLAAAAGSVPARAGASGAPVEALATSERRGPVVRVVERVSPSVVNISTEQKVENPFYSPSLDRFFSSFWEGSPSGQPGQYVQNSLGSGVIIDPRGYILTNEHVVWRASRVGVTLADRRRFDAEVIGVDPRSDLAVLKIDASGTLPAVTPGTSSDLLIGETVIAIGNPYGLSNTVTTGVVSALKRSIKAGDRVYSDFVQIDASINPGNSGGALLNIEGALIGINTAILGEGQGIGFAIPVDRARRVFDDLVRYGEVRVAWLGIEVKDLDDREYAAMAGADGDPDAGGAVSVPAPGVQVRRIYPESPAEKAGLSAGDLVMRLGDETITSRTDFETALSRFKSGDRVSMAWRKGSAERQAELSASDFPPDLSEDYLADQIGIEVGEIPAETRQRYGSLPLDGVIVTRVRNRSRAYFRGLEQGDILRGIYNLPVKDVPSLRTAVPRMVGRSAVLLKVVRGRYQYNVTVDLT